MRTFIKISLDIILHYGMDPIEIHTSDTSQSQQQRWREGSLWRILLFASCRRRRPATDDASGAPVVWLLAARTV